MALLRNIAAHQACLLPFDFGFNHFPSLTSIIAKSA
jgi:hypothetical protein